MAKRLSCLAGMRPISFLDPDDGPRTGTTTTGHGKIAQGFAFATALVGLRYDF